MKPFNLKTRALFAGVILAVLVTFAVAQAAPKTGAKAPDFKLKTLKGKTVSLDDIRKDPANKKQNRVVVLNFWATWCHFCVEEAPALQRLHDKFKKKGVAVVGVSVDRGGARDVEPFMKDHKLSYTMLLDAGAKTSREYGARGLPTTFIIDRSGKVRHVHVGATPGLEKEMEREIEALLK